MAMIKCRECKTEISSKAKTCPSCGAPNKKRAGIVTYTMLAAIGVIIFMTATMDEPDAPPVDSAVASARSAALAHFKSDAEPKVKDAAWKSDTLFSGGVLDDGTPRDGFAQYVCAELNSRGIRGVNVEVVDIVSVAAAKGFKKLGSARCN